MSGEETTGDEKPNFQGKYTLVRNENFESFLEANGIIYFPNFYFVLTRAYRTLSVG